MGGRLVYIPDPEPSQGAGSVELFAGEPDVMDVRRVAEVLGVAQATVRREIARGSLSSIHVGTRVRVTKTALLEYVGEAAR